MASTSVKEHAPVRVLAGGGLLGVAVLLAALNLRPAVTSVGSVLEEMRVSLGVSATWAGALTTLPGLCFAVVGSAAPWVSRRIGLPAAVSVSLVVLTGGLVVRVLDGPLTVFAGTFVATAGIALANVLIPVVIKQAFVARIGLMSGLYTGALQAGGAFGSAVTPPADVALGGWRQALASWAALAGLALVLWLLAARSRPGAAAPESEPEPRRSLLGNRLAWIVTLFFGLQACFAYIVLGWMPEVLVDSGVSRNEAGLLVGIVSLIGLPVSVFLVPIAARSHSQSWWVLGLGVFGLAGTVGLMVAPQASPLLWSISVGIGMSVFSLAIAFITLRARTAPDTAALSGMSQGFGYLLAAIGPFLFGLLHDLTHGWTVPFILVIATVVGQMAFGWLAGRPRFV